MGKLIKLIHFLTDSQKFAIEYQCMKRFQIGRFYAQITSKFGYECASACGKKFQTQASSDRRLNINPVFNRL